jgi:hypothetical protein
MQTGQKYHHERNPRVENSRSSPRRDNKVRRISTRSSLARAAHIGHDKMDGIAELRTEMTAGIAELRTEMIAGIAELRTEMIAGDAELRAEMIAVIVELRAEMIARFERIDRRLDESFAAITQQFVEQRAYTDFAYERLDRADQSLNAGIARLERKLDRILALVVESQARRR